MSQDAKPQKQDLVISRRLRFNPPTRCWSRRYHSRSGTSLRLFTPAVTRASHHTGCTRQSPTGSVQLRSENNNLQVGDSNTRPLSSLACVSSRTGLGPGHIVFTFPTHGCPVRLTCRSRMRSAYCRGGLVFNRARPPGLAHCPRLIQTAGPCSVWSVLSSPL